MTFLELVLMCSIGVLCVSELWQMFFFNELKKEVDELKKEVDELKKKIKELKENETGNAR